MKTALKLFQEEIVQLLTAAESRIVHCVKQLNHARIWWTPGPKQNSVGTLIRHINGNLKQWAVAGIQQKSDNRNRDSEFHSDAQPESIDLLTDLRSTIAEAINVIQQLDEEELCEPREIQSFPTTVMGAILHTVPHCVGHTHQIVQLTRMQLGPDYQFEWSPNDARTTIPL